MPKLIGQVPDTRRIITGLASLDRAFNKDGFNWGVPVGVGQEYYGFTHSGKSTFLYSLASLLSRLEQEQKGWVLCDLEGFDPSFVLDIANFQGMGEDDPISVCDGSPTKKDFSKVTAEELLDEMIERLWQGTYAAGILDSIGAISPMAEQENEIGSANWGRRAVAMAQFTRKCLRLLRREDAPTIFASNHIYDDMSGRGFTTPGGTVKNYLFSVRVRLSQHKKDRFDDGSYILRGIVDKNRWGGGRDEREFEVFIQSGYGIHPGLTAVLDAGNLGVIQKGAWIKVGDKNFRFAELREAWQEPEFFQPFHDAIEKYNKENE